METRIKSKRSKELKKFQGLSVSVVEGEKEKLYAAINKVDHDCKSFAEFNRVAINLLLEKLGSDFELTVR